MCERSEAKSERNLSAGMTRNTLHPNRRVRAGRDDEAESKQNAKVDTFGTIVRSVARV